MIHGIINVYKETGFTSHDVVAKLRGITRQRKIGHTGTLDPEAEGVLPVCLGSATHLCDLLTEKRKSYQAVMLLGQTTDTQDISGKVLSKQEVVCRKQQVRKVMEQFLGDQMQVPPMYSALKVDGRRLYDLARAGQEVDRQPRSVHFYEICFQSMKGAEVQFTVTCSKGTYIRTLCADMGERLGCGACMKSLIRYQVGGFRIEDAKTLSELSQLARRGRLEEAVLPVDVLFQQYPAFQVTQEGERFLMNGNPLTKEMLEWIPEKSDGSGKRKEEPFDIHLPNGVIRVYDHVGRFQALYEPMKGQTDRQKSYRPWKTFFDF